MKLRLILTILFLLVPFSAIASFNSASDVIKTYEQRLQKIEQRLDQLHAPIEQMGPTSAAAFDSSFDDLQMTFDDVSGRLEMIQLILSHSSAGIEKIDLAQTELKLMEVDVRDLENQSASLLRNVDEAVKF